MKKSIILMVIGLLLACGGSKSWAGQKYFHEARVFDQTLISVYELYSDDLDNDNATIWIEQTEIGSNKPTFKAITKKRNCCLRNMDRVGDFIIIPYTKTDYTDQKDEAGLFFFPIRIGFCYTNSDGESTKIGIRKITFPDAREILSWKWEYCGDYAKMPMLLVVRYADRKSLIKLELTTGNTTNLRDFFGVNIFLGKYWHSEFCPYHIALMIVESNGNAKICNFNDSGIIYELGSVWLDQTTWIEDFNYYPSSSDSEFELYINYTSGKGYYLESD